MANNNRKVVLIGTGMVGMSFAYAALNQSVCDELALIDLNDVRAKGEAMDLNHGLAFSNSSMKIYFGDYSDCSNANIAVICAGVAQKPGESRLELLQRNTKVFSSIVPRVVSSGFDGIFLVATNPVDIMTYVFTKISGLPENQIIGSGTVLDTARLRYDLSNHFKVAQKNIHAYVFGEHSDTSFIPWSCADISGCSLMDYEDLMISKGVVTDRIDPEKTLQYVRKSGGEIIAKKGATFYAVSASVNKICNALVAAYDSVSTVSSMMHGEYGIDDVCLSTMTIIGPEGVKGKVPAKLTYEEISKLQASANALKEVIKNLDI